MVASFMPPRRIVLRGENPTTFSIDEIVVDQDGAGCCVSYDGMRKAVGARAEG